MAIEFDVHNISAPDSPNPVVTELYLDGCTVRYFTFANVVGKGRDELTIRLFDYSDRARREREDTLYSWGGSAG